MPVWIVQLNRPKQLWGTFIEKYFSKWALSAKHKAAFFWKLLYVWITFSDDCHPQWSRYCKNVIWNSCALPIFPDFSWSYLLSVKYCDVSNENKIKQNKISFLHSNIFQFFLFLLKQCLLRITHEAQNYTTTCLFFCTICIPTLYDGAYQYKTPTLSKSVLIWSFFWSVFSRIRTEYGPGKTPYMDTFHAVGHSRKGYF